MDEKLKSLLFAATDESLFAWTDPKMVGRAYGYLEKVEGLSFIEGQTNRRINSPWKNLPKQIISPIIVYKVVILSVEYLAFRFFHYSINFIIAKRYFQFIKTHCFESIKCLFHNIKKCQSTFCRQTHSSAIDWQIVLLFFIILCVIPVFSNSVSGISITK